jgi:hypothetical protein
VTDARTPVTESSIFGFFVHEHAFAQQRFVHAHSLAQGSVAHDGGAEAPSDVDDIAGAGVGGAATGIVGATGVTGGGSGGYGAGGAAGDPGACGATGRAAIPGSSARAVTEESSVAPTARVAIPIPRTVFKSADRRSSQVAHSKGPPIHDASPLGR